MDTPPLLSELPDSKYFQTPKQNFSCINCKKKAKYQCPKCKSHYCDLLCYKNHNPECSEEFYKEQVTQHLKGQKVSETEIKKMKRILQKYKDENNEDDSISEIDENIRNKQISRLNELKELLDKGDLTIEKLTPEEQLEFQKFIDQQKENWKPWKPYWWIDEFVPSLLLLDQENINDISDSDDILTKTQKKLKEKRILIKSRIDKLPDLKSLTKKPIIDELPNHLINILYGSCFILRLFNGDLMNNSEESLGILMNVSRCLYVEPRCSFGSIGNALNQACEASIMTEGQLAKDFIEIILIDMAQIFKNKFFIFEILFKIYDLCHCLEDPIEENELKKTLSKIKQKLIFFMSFCKSEVTFSLMEKWRIQIQEYQKSFDLEKREAQTLGYYKKLNLLL